MDKKTALVREQRQYSLSLSFNECPVTDSSLEELPPELKESKFVSWHATLFFRFLKMSSQSETNPSVSALQPSDVFWCVSNIFPIDTSS